MDALFFFKPPCGVDDGFFYPSNATKEKSRLFFCLFPADEHAIFHLSLFYSHRFVFLAPLSPRYFSSPHTFFFGFVKRIPQNVDRL